jgi:hypothetical protein
LEENIMRKRRISFEAPRRRQRRFSPLALIGGLVSLAVILLGVTAWLLLPRLTSHAAGADQQVNMDCNLVVPPHPLTARGLATPYQLVASNPNNGPCNEANASQSAFVQASVFNFNTGQISVYNPLVIDQGTQPAIQPVVPQIPSGSVVAIWFGFNGDNLTLVSDNNSLQEGHCVNGVQNSIFGQFAYCNALLFFGETNQDISWNRLTVPPLGTAKDGKPCMSTRDFGLVDQDQSDNVTTAYLVTKNGRTAQLTAANQKRLPNAQTLANGSDNGLLDSFVDPALGCMPWMAPDLANPGHMATALPLDELQAMVNQKAPVAFVPISDPMALNNNKPDLNKTNAYRAGVDQPRAQNASQADPKAYCQNLVTTGAPRIALDAPMTVQMATPDAATGNTLFTFLAQRFVGSYMMLNCQQLLGKPDPMATMLDNNGVAISATLDGKPINTGNGGGNGGGNGNGGNNGAPNCSIDGQNVPNCAGTATVNGQSCTLSFANNTMTMTCNKPK